MPNGKLGLTPHQLDVLYKSQTERPFDSPYVKPTIDGAFACRGCGQVLFLADNQFASACGWPSFDQATDAVDERLDPDGRRTEIVCQSCQGHLGHVFLGEGYTVRDRRYCVNGLILDWLPEVPKVEHLDEAIFAGGCFWGVQRALSQLSGVYGSEVGYCGGHQLDPTYAMVCAGQSGHAESVRVLFDPNELAYSRLVEAFFALHDPSDAGGQGVDRGSQYRSVGFYHDDAQLASLNASKGQWSRRTGLDCATEVTQISAFWPGEREHQYYHWAQYPYRYWSM